MGVSEWEVERGCVCGNRVKEWTTCKVKQSQVSKDGVKERVSEGVSRGETGKYRYIKHGKI